MDVKVTCRWHILPLPFIYTTAAHHGLIKAASEAVRQIGSRRQSHKREDRQQRYEVLSILCEIRCRPQINEYEAFCFIGDVEFLQRDLS